MPCHRGPPSSTVRFVSLITASIAQYREAHGLAQWELAKLIGCTQRQVGRLEAGEVVPSIATLQLLSAFFNYSDAQLVDYVRSVDAVRSGPKSKRRRRSRTRNARPPAPEALAA